MYVRKNNYSAEAQCCDSYMNVSSLVKRVQAKRHAATSMALHTAVMYAARLHAF
jgi:hypothetical protein